MGYIVFYNEVDKMWKLPYVLFLVIMWSILSLHQISIYELDVYDCSNMVADQEVFFNDLGIDTKIGVRYPIEGKHGHVWLILPFNIPFECTVLMPKFLGGKSDETFESINELIEVHPEYRSDFF